MRSAMWLSIASTQQFRLCIVQNKGRKISSKFSNQVELTNSLAQFEGGNFQLFLSEGQNTPGSRGKASKIESLLMTRGVSFKSD